MTAKGNAVLVEALGSSLRRGGAALEDVPALLKRILAEEAWREFVTPRGEVAQHKRFSDFVTTAPTRGLGASMELIDRIVGTSDPDLLRLLREAKKGKRGRPSLKEIPSDSEGISLEGDDSPYMAERLSRDAPDEYEAVRRGEKTIHAAAIAAGIRNRRIPVRLNDPESAARTLRRHMTPGDLQALARLLAEPDPTA